MAKLSKLIYIVIQASILLVSIVLAIVFSFAGDNNVGGGFFSFADYDHGDLAIYVVFKVLVSLALVVISVLHLLKKRQEGVMVIDLTLTYLLQLLPLLIRGLSQVPVHKLGSEDWMWGINLAVGVIVMLAYVAYILLFSVSNKRYLANKEQVNITKEKPVESVSDMALNDKGDFVGPKK